MSDFLSSAALAAVLPDAPLNTVTGLDLPLVNRGKVREVFSLDAGHLLFVATDRISAFDVILSEGVPGKGMILTEMSRRWFDLTRDIVPNHLGDPALAASWLEAHPELRHRTLVVRKLEPLPVEAVVRGYLSGSGWKDYQRSGEVSGHRLPAGLQESAQLPEAIFTPSTKAQSGHDEAITREQVAGLIGEARAAEVERLSLALYRFAADHARRAGIILADTKFEFGLDPAGQIVLIDEIFTPDSSRFWPADAYQPGQPQPSFDKQYVRDFLEAQPWNKTPPPPTLPPEILAGTRDRYLEAYRRLFG